MATARAAVGNAGSRFGAAEELAGGRPAAGAQGKKIRPAESQE